MAATDHHRAVAELFEGKFSPAQNDDRLDERRHPAGHHQHRRHDGERHRLAQHGRDPVSPGTRRVHDLGRLDRAGARLDPPVDTDLRQAGHGDAFQHLGALLDRAPTESLGRAERIGSAIAARDHATGTMIGHRRHQALQFGTIDQLFVGEATQTKIFDTGAKAREFSLVLGHQHRAVALEAAIVADQLLDMFP